MQGHAGGFARMRQTQMTWLATGLALVLGLGPVAAQKKDDKAAPPVDPKQQAINALVSATNEAMKGAAGTSAYTADLVARSVTADPATAVADDPGGGLHEGLRQQGLRAVHGHAAAWGDRPGRESRGVHPPGAARRSAARRPAAARPEGPEGEGKAGQEEEEGQGSPGSRGPGRVGRGVPLGGLLRPDGRAPRGGWPPDLQPPLQRGGWRLRRLRGRGVA